jgi:hypothetical protein
LQDVVKSGHAVVEEENAMMMGRNRTSRGGARTSERRRAPVAASNEWDNDSDWIEDEDPQGIGGCVIRNQWENHRLSGNDGDWARHNRKGNSDPLRVVDLTP